VLAVSDLDYHLPERLIATEPSPRRDAARLMVLRRHDPEFIAHLTVADLPLLLARNDLLIVNDSRVLPARLQGKRADTGGKVEGLFLGVEPETAWGAPLPHRELLAASMQGEMPSETLVSHEGFAAATPETLHGPRSGIERWRIMLKGRRMKPGIFIGLEDAHGLPAGVSLKLIGRTAAEPHGDASSHILAPDAGTDVESENDAWIVEVFACGPEAGQHRRGALPTALLDRIGTTPLPPYIRSSRRRTSGTYGEHGGDASLPPQEAAARDQIDRERYQTVYARPNENIGSGAEHHAIGQSTAGVGSVAAPTAGLHFTEELLARLAAAGISRHAVTLHVGTGTFKTVETEFVEQHPMHAEWCEVPPQTARAIAHTKSTGGRIIAVGTTSARTLESFPVLAPSHQSHGKWTRLLITPGFDFAHMDGLMTNFHLPRSTLLAMVGAFLPGGTPRLLRHYALAIAEGYRFYSYGDAMIILP